MKVQRARSRLVSLIVLCAFALVLVLSVRSVRLLPEAEEPVEAEKTAEAEEPVEAGNEQVNEEYDEQAPIIPGPDTVPVETVPPADSLDTFGL